MYLNKNDLKYCGQIHGQKYNINNNKLKIEKFEMPS